MSDSLPENSFSGIIRVVKLTSGEELIGLISDASPDKYTIKLPARLDTFYNRDANGELFEFVKLTNYLSNIQGFVINIPRDVVIYMGSATPELEKMYETYMIAMETDPKVVVTSGETDQAADANNGLHLLNELFNNEDFVNFVNDLIENFEGAEILIEDDDEVEETEPESPVAEKPKEEAPKPPKAKKRRTMNPEAKKLPYNPEANPNSAEGWSDNPEDYI